MAFSFARFGNDLYTGKRSVDVVGRWRTWLGIGVGIILVSVLILLLKGLNPGIEFRGGSEFRISDAKTLEQSLATEIVGDVVPQAGEQARVSVIGQNSIRVQTERLTNDQTDELRGALADGYGVEASGVTSSFVGASWGADITGKAITALLTFLVLVALVITIYFRAWQMAVAALLALVHDLAITAGVYSLTGFEVTPATVIGFLTILGYSLYDTVVVFDKVRENTAHVMSSTRRTYSEAVNLAVNQTLVRSINTSVVALLPVGSILFIGALLLGAGTLRDISLALFVGILAGTFSSVFIAPPLLVLLKRREPAILEQEARVHKARESAARARAAQERGEELVTAGAGTPTATVVSGAGRSAAAERPTGPRNQPKRASRQRPSGRKR